MNISLEYITFINILIIGYLILSLFKGYKRGFILQIIGIISIIIGFGLSMLLCTTFAENFKFLQSASDSNASETLMNEFGNVVIWFMILYFIIKIIVNYLGVFINKLFRLPILKTVNQVLCVISGFFISSLSIILVASILRFPIFSNGEEIIEKSLLKTVSNSTIYVSDTIVNEFINSNIYNDFVTNFNLEDASESIDNNMDSFNKFIKMISSLNNGN